MSNTLPPLPRSARRRLRRVVSDANLLQVRVASLSDYLIVFQAVASAEETYWFRGHGDLTWSLTPSALRYEDEGDREQALGLVREFKRVVEMKLPSPPRPDEDLKWLQLAQHYGLPTRLLDWTRNAAVALYFACQNLRADGLVFVFNPVDLNRATIGEARILDALRDDKIIAPYLTIGPRMNAKGPGTIAINPVLNSERISLQRACFTLHGTRSFALTPTQAPSLVALPIVRESKECLLAQLEGVGVDEMSIFPEPEHTCRQLKRSARLPF